MRCCCVPVFCSHGQRISWGGESRKHAYYDSSCLGVKWILNAYIEKFLVRSQASALLAALWTLLLWTTLLAKTYKHSTHTHIYETRHLIPEIPEFNSPLDLSKTSKHNQLEGLIRLFLDTMDNQRQYPMSHNQVC